MAASTDCSWQFEAWGVYPDVSIAARMSSPHNLLMGLDWTDHCLQSGVCMLRALSTWLLYEHYTDSFHQLCKHSPTSQSLNSPLLLRSFLELSCLPSRDLFLSHPSLMSHRKADSAFPNKSYCGELLWERWKDIPVRQTKGQLTTLRKMVRK